MCIERDLEWNTSRSDIPRCVWQQQPSSRSHSSETGKRSTCDSGRCCLRLATTRNTTRFGERYMSTQTTAARISEYGSPMSFVSSHGCFVTDDRWNPGPAVFRGDVDVYKLRPMTVFRTELVTTGSELPWSRNERHRALHTRRYVQLCFGRHIASSKRVSVFRCCRQTGETTPARSQVDAFYLFRTNVESARRAAAARPHRGMSERLCSTGQISAQCHIQVAEFRCACL